MFEDRFSQDTDEWNTGHRGTDDVGCKGSASGAPGGRRGDGSDDRGVSPVIGIILMVAITVVMSAVVGAFVLDVGKGNEQEVAAGVTIECIPERGDVEVTWISNRNAEEIEVTFEDYFTETLTEVGASERQSLGAGVYTVVVTAVGDEEKTVVEKKTCDLNT